MAEFRFCPRCGSALEARVLKTGEPMRLVCTSPTCGFVFYQDPKVAVGTIIRAPDGGIVLVRRAIEPGYGLWVFPGGYVDRGEDVRLAAVREAREEAGIDVRLDDLVGIYSYAGSTPVVIVYSATWTSGELALDEENSEVTVFSPAEVPWDALAFRSTSEALRDFLNAQAPAKR